MPWLTVAILAVGGISAQVRFSLSLFPCTNWLIDAGEFRSHPWAAHRQTVRLLRPILRTREKELHASLYHRSHCVRKHIRPNRFQNAGVRFSRSVSVQVASPSPSCAPTNAIAESTTSSQGAVFFRKRTQNSSSSSCPTVIFGLSLPTGGG